MERERDGERGAEREGERAREKWTDRFKLSVIMGCTVCDYP